MSQYVARRGEEHAFHHAVFRGYLDSGPQLALATDCYRCGGGGECPLPRKPCGGPSGGPFIWPACWPTPLNLNTAVRICLPPAARCSCAAFFGEVVAGSDRQQQQQQSGDQQHAQAAAAAAQAQAQAEEDPALRHVPQERRSAVDRLFAQPLLQQLVQVGGVAGCWAGKADALWCVTTAPSLAPTWPQRLPLTHPSAGAWRRAVHALYWLPAGAAGAGAGRRGAARRLRPGGQAAAGAVPGGLQPALQGALWCCGGGLPSGPGVRLRCLPGLQL